MFTKKLPNLENLKRIVKSRYITTVANLFLKFRGSDRILSVDNRGIHELIVYYISKGKRWNISLGQANDLSIKSMKELAKLVTQNDKS